MSQTNYDMRGWIVDLRLIESVLWKIFNFFLFWATVPIQGKCCKGFYISCLPPEYYVIGGLLEDLLKKGEEGVLLIMDLFRLLCFNIHVFLSHQGVAINYQSYNHYCAFSLGSKQSGPSLYSYFAFALKLFQALESAEDRKIVTGRILWFFFYIFWLQDWIRPSPFTVSFYIIFTSRCNPTPIRTDLLFLCSEKLLRRHSPTDIRR